MADSHSRPPKYAGMYLHARYYDPSLGIFLSPDRLHPTKPAVGSNRYAYSFGNPANGTDRSGQEMRCAITTAEEIQGGQTYEVYYNDLWQPYSDWRKLYNEELVAMNEVKKQALTRMALV